MRSAIDDRKTVTFTSFGPSRSTIASVPDQCEMCGNEGPVLECEMSGSGVSYRLFVCSHCASELVEEVATLTAPGNKIPAGAC